ncbi:unnamed protein product [Rotaria sp. Silwood1]|nr:unnamed protein product [Rotaria sp. Silwood1]CAF3350094.1 unnamed protein product [Rotaria sp. Silwood1]CAF4642019.1 unnamed protein product [Rotaria sp. Silwood1]
MASGFEDEKLNACCLTEYRQLPGTPRGKIIKITDISTYHIAGTDHASKNKAMVLLTAIFGLTKNPRITADELSEKAGFDIYIPDLFNGNPITSSFLQGIPQVSGEKMSIGIKKIKTLRSEKGTTRVQAVGYCFGGLYALLVGSKELHLADAIVGCHVSLTNKTHYEQLDVPATFVYAQQEDQFTDALRAEAEHILARKSEIPSKFLLTKGTVHGFAARPDPDNTTIMNAYKQANDFIAEWLKAHL